MNTVAHFSQGSISPLGSLSQVGAEEVTRKLCEVFRVFGMPKELRLDNGQPWKWVQGIPSNMELFLVGYGVGCSFNKPHCPKENAKVERCNGTTQRWIEPAECSTYKQIQRRLNRSAYVHLNNYPLGNGQTRTEKYKKLTKNKRQFSKDNFSLPAVQKFLEERIRHTRMVENSGTIRWYGGRLQVGCQYAKRHVIVTYNAQENSWVISDESGKQIKSFSAIEITQERVLSFSVSKNFEKSRSV